MVSLLASSAEGCRFDPQPDQTKDIVTGTVTVVVFSFTICGALPPYISRLIRYSRACASYQNFINRVLLLAGKLLNQEKIKIITPVAIIIWLTDTK